jgi:DNA-binding IclR family transcriptional regulator
MTAAPSRVAHPRTYTIAPIVHAFAVLEVLAKAPAGPSHVGRTLGLHKNKAFRVLRTLVEVGVVEEVGGDYRLTGECVRRGMYGGAALLQRSQAVVYEALALLGAIEKAVEA